MMFFYLENPWKFQEKLLAFIIQRVIRDSIDHYWCLPESLEIISF